MISNEKYKKILDSGLILDHYFILCNISVGKPFPDSKRIQGFINLLSKKGFIKDEQLTDKGKDLIDAFDDALIGEPQEFTTGSTTTTTTFERPKNIFQRNHLGVWTDSMHVKCQDKLLELTGRKQVRAVIDKKIYSFLPNAIDFGKTLTKVITLYKLSDYDKIEKALLKYIEKCNSENQWFPLMQYFIFKNGASQMVTFMEEEDGNDYKDGGSSQKFL